MNYRLFFILFCAPLTSLAMEPVVMTDETTPLIAPQRLVMDDHEKTQSIFYDGTRAFYDDEARRKMRNEIIEECVCATAATTAGMVCFGCVFGNSLAGCICACANGNSQAGTLFCHQTGGLFFELGMASGSGGSLFGGLFVGGIACSEAKKKISAKSSTLSEFDFKGYNEISKVGRTDKIFWIKKGVLNKLLKRVLPATGYMSRFSGWISEKFSCSENHKKMPLKMVAQRLEQRLNIRTLLADTFYKDHKLPKEVIKYLFKYIDFTLLDTHSYVSEKEFLCLLQCYTDNDSQVPKDLRRFITKYKLQALLAQNGWIAFTKSEKYPIRCEMKYFNTHTLAQTAKEWYSAGHGPVIYLPFSPQLAQCYKFEEDPAYAKEHVDPSDMLIRVLLILRQNFIA